MKLRLSNLGKLHGKKILLSISVFIGLCLLAPLAAEEGADPLEKRLSRLEERLSEMEEARDDTEGFRWGGYGELVYIDPRSPYKKNQADVQRLVMLAEYNFTDWIRFISEFEYEHGGYERTTIAGSSFNAAEVFLEQSYMNFRFSDELEVSLGLYLLPIGLVNVRHEPTTFLGVSRPRSDQKVIPSTWRELGLMLHGKLGDRVRYKTGFANGPRAKDFSDTSWIRGGRTKGSLSRAEGLGAFLSLDFLLASGITLGGSYYQGESGQGEIAAVDWKTRLNDPLDNWSDGTGLKSALQEIRDNRNKRGRVRVHLAEAHLKIRRGPWMGQAQFVQGWMDEQSARNVNSATGKNVGQRVEGAYGELGYNVLSFFRTSQKLYPFFRYEYLNTQKETVRRYYGGREDQMDFLCANVLAGTCKTTSSLSNGNRDLGVIAASDSGKELYGIKGVADRTNDQRITTLGFAWFPDPAVVVKLEYERQDSKSDYHSDIESRNSSNNKIDRVQFMVGFGI